MKSAPDGLNCRTWIPLPPRAQLQEAGERGGLLLDAVKQLVQTWNDAPARMRRQTWYGNLRRHLDDVLPEGRWTVDWTRPVPFWVDGVPIDNRTTQLGRYFVKQRWQKRWLSRQKSLIQRRPPLTSQDYFLCMIVRARGPWAHVFESGLIVDSDDDEEVNFQEIYESLPTNVIFPQIPSIQASAFRKLVSTLAGKEDFASITAHFLRRDKFPFLAHDENKMLLVLLQDA